MLDDTPAREYIGDWVSEKGGYMNILSKVMYTKAIDPTDMNN